MSWKAMADDAGDVANSGSSDNGSHPHDVASGSWDPHQVWLTRVKQPRDGRPLPLDPASPKSASPATRAKLAIGPLRRA